VSLTLAAWAAPKTSALIELSYLTYNGLMKIKFKLVYCFALLSFSVIAQTTPPKGSQTYSPYTPEQLRELNNQPISPTEGPFGPVETPPQEQGLSKRPPGNSKYYNNPEGEDEAEAIETQSADPYTPSTPVYRF